MLKFFHLICGTTFLGISIAAFFYIARSIRIGNRSVIDYSLRVSYFGDAMIFFLAVLQFFTATQLVRNGHFSLTIPWIQVAYIAFSTVIFLWLSNFVLKIFYLTKSPISRLSVKLFYIFNILLIFIFIIIIHDAITQNTWFDFLFRK